MLKIKNKKYPTYNQLYKKRQIEKKQIEEIQIKEELIEIKNIVEKFADTLEVSKEQIYNAMGLNRFNLGGL